MDRFTFLNTLYTLNQEYISKNLPFPPTAMDKIREIEDTLRFSTEDWVKEEREAMGFNSYKLAENGNYSEFERVHPVFRNYLATNAINTYGNFLDDIYKPDAVYDDKLRKEAIRPYAMNPAIRLGISLKSRQNPVFQKIDDDMIDIIMEDTLKPMTEQQIESVQAMTGDKQVAQDMIEQNVEKQVQVAKMMLMTHLGSTKLMKDNKEIPMERSVASMMAHCSRTAFVFPPGETKEVATMIGNLTGANMGKASGIYGRFAATHSTGHGKTIDQFKEKKTISFRHQYGMDLAIGGLGNAGIMGANDKAQTLKNDGTCGHMYMRVDQGGKDKTSSLLIGFESDSPSAVGNQQGHTHTASAAPEYMSSFLGQRNDEMGEKYGGRIVDCTMFQPQELSLILEHFTAQYRGMVYEAMKNPEARIRLEQANAMLSGKLMDSPQLETCLNKAGLSMDQAQLFTQISANKKDLDYQMDSKKIGDRAARPLKEVEKPGKRVHVRAFFGSSSAKKKLQDYKEYISTKKDMAASVTTKKAPVKMSFDEFSRETSADTKSRRNQLLESRGKSLSQRQPQQKQISDEIKQRGPAPKGPRG